MRVVTGENIQGEKRTGMSNDLKFHMYPAWTQYAYYIIQYMKINGDPMNRNHILPSTLQLPFLLNKQLKGQHNHHEAKPNQKPSKLTWQI